MRVVTLLPAATEIVCALGASDALVGISHACDYPPYVGALPRVTRSEVPARSAASVDAEVSRRLAAAQPLFTLDAGLIAGLRPDLLVTQAVCDVCAVREDEVRRLAAGLAPPPAVVALGAGDLGGIFDDIGHLGNALGAADEALELVAGLRGRLRAVHDRLRAARPPRPRVAVLEWMEPLYVAGHWVPELIHRAGGLDVLTEPGTPSRRIDSAALDDAKPEIVIVAPCGLALQAAIAAARSLARTEGLRGLSGASIWAVDGNALVSRPGPRVVTACEQFARILHPGVFGAPSDEYCARVA